MPRRYRPQEVIRVLEYLGWQWVRTRGDHAIMRLEGGGRRPVPVPIARRELFANLFSDILRETDLSREEFEAAAEEVL